MRRIHMDSRLWDGMPKRDLVEAIVHLDERLVIARELAREKKWDSALKVLDEYVSLMECKIELATGMHLHDQ